jgi:hypothetical protein
MPTYRLNHELVAGTPFLRVSIEGIFHSLPSLAIDLGLCQDLQVRWVQEVG